MLIILFQIHYNVKQIYHNINSLVIHSMINLKTIFIISVKCIHFINLNEIRILWTSRKLGWYVWQKIINHFCSIGCDNLCINDKLWNIVCIMIYFLSNWTTARTVIYKIYVKLLFGWFTVLRNFCVSQIRDFEFFHSDDTVRISYKHRQCTNT